MYEIEKKVPIAPMEGRGVKKARYPFGRMEVGDSIFIPAEHVAHSAQPRNSASGAASAYGRRHSKRFVTRSIYENGDVIGYRVWRVD